MSSVHAYQRAFQLVFFALTQVFYYCPATTTPAPVVAERNKYKTVAELRLDGTRYVFRLREGDGVAAVRKYVNSCQVSVQHFRSVELLRQRYTCLKRQGFVPA